MDLRSLGSQSSTNVYLSSFYDVFRLNNGPLGCYKSVDFIWIRRKVNTVTGCFALPQK